jgi:hypothetical protein
MQRVRVLEKEVLRREFAPNRERINKGSFGGKKSLIRSVIVFSLQNTGFSLCGAA